MTISYKDKTLHFDGQNILDIATKHQTPFYIYSENVIKNNFNLYHESFGNTQHTICYSVKANSNLSILSLLAHLGSGFDIVSAGELSRVIKAGGDPQKTVFSGVGKTQEEIIYALDANILCFNVESEDELYTINEIAIDMNTKANISVRVNPAISVDTHPYITTGMKDNKFGIEQSQILPMYIKASKLAGINIMGIDFHIGSQIMDINPYIESLNKILEIIDQLDSHGIMLKHIDIGGGLGISYRNESAVSKDTFVTEIIHAIGERNLSIIAEPGRSIVGESGLLVSKVTNIKKTPFKNFAVVDAGMNDLLRPPLYEAYHSIKEVLQKSDAKLLYDVVGPICETADFLGKSRNLTIEKGDFLVVENVGAYGYSLSSNYNTRPKIDEYIISNSNINKIRDRETIEQILENELKYL
jgi:diaminopimelate decarboxylase